MQSPPQPLHAPSLPQSHPAHGFPQPPGTSKRQVCSPRPGPCSPFLLRPPCLAVARPSAPSVLTAPALALLVPPDEGVAKKHQDQQGQPDTQGNPEHVDGLLPCKAEGEGALQTNASRRLGVLIVPWGGQNSCGAGIRPSTLCCPYGVEGLRSARLLNIVAQRFLLPPKPCAGDL